MLIIVYSLSIKGYIRSITFHANNGGKYRFISIFFFFILLYTLSLLWLIDSFIGLHRYNGGRGFLLVKSTVYIKFCFCSWKYIVLNFFLVFFYCFVYQCLMWMVNERCKLVIVSGWTEFVMHLKHFSYLWFFVCFKFSYFFLCTIKRKNLLQSQFVKIKKKNIFSAWWWLEFTDRISLLSFL